MRFIEHDDMLQTFPPDAPEEALHIRMLPMSISLPPWQVLSVRSRPNTGSHLEAQRSVERTRCAAAPM
jgi:hypothetical protein